MPNLYRQILAAFIMFSRLPLPSQSLKADDFSRAVNFLPVPGLAIGAITSGIFLLAEQYLPNEAAVIIALITGILLTGAMHEDGFADCCDAFGATKDKEKILSIMKDSTLGTYGVLGLIGLMLLKFSLLTGMPAEKTAIAILIMHVAGRLFIGPLLFTLSPLQTGNAKLSENLFISPTAWAMQAILFGTAASLLPYTLIFAASGILLLQLVFIHIYLKKRLGGFNGDTLGFAEQLHECTVLVCFTVFYV